MNRESREAAGDVLAAALAWERDAAVASLAWEELHVWCGACGELLDPWGECPRAGMPGHLDEHGCELR